jgi:hypothetical protein
MNERITKANNSEYLTTKDVSERLHISIRSVQKKVKALSKVEETKYIKRQGRKILILSTWLDESTERQRTPTNDPTPTIKTNTHKMELEVLKRANSKLESTNDKLMTMIADKDKLIVQNIEDFKTLTSKVLYLQERATEPVPVTEPESIQTKLDMLMLLIGIGITVVLFIAIYEIFVK